MKTQYEYVTDCSSVDDAESITKMIDADDYIGIDYEEFMDNVNKEAIRDMFPDYDWFYCGGLTLKDDHHAVAFHKGTFRGMKAYIVEHSRIEYVFTENGEYEGGE